MKKNYFLVAFSFMFSLLIFYCSVRSVLFIAPLPEQNWETVDSNESPVPNNKKRKH